MDDGRRTMADYAKEAVKPFGGHNLSEDEKQTLGNDWFAPFLRKEDSKHHQSSLLHLNFPE